MLWFWELWDNSKAVKALKKHESKMKAEGRPSIWALLFWPAVLLIFFLGAGF